MRRLLDRLSTSLLAGVLAATLACGTLLYPERRGMDDPGRVDPAVIVMDGALLLFFLAPGVIAFAVDIATGAIYEPAGGRLVRRDSGEAPSIAVAGASRPELRLSPAQASRLPGPIWWETAEGARIPMRVVAEAEDGASAHFRLESGVSLEPGAHRLWWSDRGSPRSIEITVL